MTTAPATRPPAPAGTPEPAGSPPPAGPGADVAELARRTRAFVDDHVLPVERELVVAGRHMDDDVRVDLQRAARAAGVFGPLTPVGLGGLGLSNAGLAEVLEAAGRSLIGPTAVNCAAPDDGNMHLLAAVCTQAQAERYLHPLLRGETRSSIALTEPAPGAGSDPSMVRTSAVPVDGGWVIDGAKHFITGAEGAAFTICIARTEGGTTMFLVDQDNPGLRVGRRMPTLDHSAAGGHCEVTFADCFVPDDAVLGDVGAGLRYAQVRLAPSRLAFCMAWLGLAARAHEMAAAWITGRSSFGQRISDHGMAQAHVADNEIDIAAARALVRSVARVLDEEGLASSGARHGAAIAKTFVAEAVWRVLDRVVQLYGGLGICEDHLVARFLVEARGFRIYEGSSEVLRASIARRVLRAHSSPAPISPEEAR
ncbi:acyl-CoA dehydrogenase [Frankia sp. CcI49]|uniref:acyl-CoA dehydrogenase family protein n=1 Tax=unclassified Frankia TaxID=2632575 RepID=UPI0006CA3A1A|nr:MULTISPECIES: acyl-CoA dehydrogenase family protein [unclassified Frankia]KPM53921.1 acyl-CoA dehydrogenase [Frankia sp. R43]ONH61873.1 acyl-CoA dehydrogenase [Frankia sp. CcI49]